MSANDLLPSGMQQPPVTWQPTIPAMPGQPSFSQAVGNAQLPASGNMFSPQAGAAYGNAAQLQPPAPSFAQAQPAAGYAQPTPFQQLMPPPTGGAPSDSKVGSSVSFSQFFSDNALSIALGTAVVVGGIMYYNKTTHLQSQLDLHLKKASEVRAEMEESVRRLTEERDAAVAAGGNGSNIPPNFVGRLNDGRIVITEDGIRQIVKENVEELEKKFVELKQQNEMLAQQLTQFKQSNDNLMQQLHQGVAPGQPAPGQAVSGQAAPAQLPPAQAAPAQPSPAQAAPAHAEPPVDEDETPLP